LTIPHTAAPRGQPGGGLITASLLYDLANCPHRVTMELFADPSARDKVSPFVQLLWERGAVFERETIARLECPFTDLSRYGDPERERLTIEAIARGDELIYAGRLQNGDLLGEPDLLRKELGGYVAGDIKSGAGEEGANDDSEGKPKQHYAVQLGLYTDILERLGFSAGRRAFVWDIHGEEVVYDFTALYGSRNPRTLWTDYEEHLLLARQIICGGELTRPALSAVCKNCVWYSSCGVELEQLDDLTLIPELGRSVRDAMLDRLPTVRELAQIEIGGFLDAKGKKTIFPRVGPTTLEKFQARAKLLSADGAVPYLRSPIILPVMDLELFFDIEVDPMRDVCYLHGFIERRAGDNATERFVSFFAEFPTPEAEERAFASAWEYLKSVRPCAIYFYSKYERTWYRNLQRRYPHVCTAGEVEELFDPAHSIDLYADVVKRATEWPTHDHSIKTLAKFLGFNWRDTHPSGAASIEWFHRWVESGDALIRQRILDYNEDDCRATRYLLDGIRSLSVI
jgi:predicted RecB family nuclease